MRESLSRQAEDAVGDVAEGTCPLCRVGLRIHDDRASAAITDARAAADREEALTVWLDQRGTGSSWRIAPILASSGVDVAWCERVGNVLTGDTLEPGLTWLASGWLHFPPQRTPRRRHRRT